MSRKVVSFQESGNTLRFVDDKGDEYVYLANKFSSVAEVEAEISRKVKKPKKPKKKDLLVSDLIDKSVTEVKIEEVVVPEVPKDA